MGKAILAAAAAALSLSACSLGMTPEQQRAQDEWDALTGEEQELACLLVGGEADYILDDPTTRSFMSEEDIATLEIVARNC